MQWPAAVLLAAALVGCRRGGELLIPVQGRVTLQGKPLAAGAISFRPDVQQANGSLHQPTGRIDADGKYRLFVGRREGAPPGHYKVVVFANEPTEENSQHVHPGMPKSLIDRRYNAPQTTPLAAEVKPGAASASFDFDLEPAA